MITNIGLKERIDVCPFDVLEEFAEDKGWQLKSRNDNEIAIDITTPYGTIGLFCIWSNEIEILQISAIMNTSINTLANSSVFELLSLINERLFMGHFSIISGTNFPIYRNSSILDLRNESALVQMCDLVELAVSEATKYFPTFSKLEGGSSASGALAHVMQGTFGRA